LEIRSVGADLFMGHLEEQTEGQRNMLKEILSQFFEECTPIEILRNPFGGAEVFLVKLKSRQKNKQI
jgi:hypothetical protein